MVLVVLQAPAGGPHNYQYHFRYEVIAYSILGSMEVSKKMETQLRTPIHSDPYCKDSQKGTPNFWKHSYGAMFLVVLKAPTAGPGAASSAGAGGAGAACFGASAGEMIYGYITGSPLNQGKWE